MSACRPRLGGLLCAGAAALALTTGCAWWRSISPPEWSARPLPDRPGVIELDSNRAYDDRSASVRGADGRIVLECESVPFRAVVPPGRYRVVVESPGRGWYEAKAADIEVEVAPCVTEQLLVELSFRLGGGQGRILRHDRTWLASDPHSAAARLFLIGRAANLRAGARCELA